MKEVKQLKNAIISLAELLVSENVISQEQASVSLGNLMEPEPGDIKWVERMIKELTGISEDD